MTLMFAATVTVGIRYPVLRQMHLLRRWRSTLLIVTATTVVAVLANQPKVFAADEKIIFRFGNSSVALERSLIPHQPHPLRYSAKEWARLSEYKVSPDQSVFFRLPEAETIPEASRCRKLKYVALVYSRLPARSAPDSRRPLGHMQSVRTIYPNVSRLVLPAGQGNKNEEYYEFDAEDLRDHWGDKQIFLIGDATVILRIQVALNIQIRAAPPTNCFFRDGESLTRHIRTFVLQRMASNL
jgi:hypothetical protein